MLRATLLNPKGQPVSPTATLLPDKMYNVKATNFGEPEVTSVKQLDKNSYEVSIKASGIIPILWIDIKDSVKRKYEILSYLNDNAFVMTQSETKVILYIVSSKSEFSITKDDVTVCHIASC